MSPECGNRRLYEELETAIRVIRGKCAASQSVRVATAAVRREETSGDAAEETTITSLWLDPSAQEPLREFCDTHGDNTSVQQQQESAHQQDDNVFRCGMDEWSH